VPGLSHESFPAHGLYRFKAWLGLTALYQPEIKKRSRVQPNMVPKPVIDHADRDSRPRRRQASSPSSAFLGGETEKASLRAASPQPRQIQALLSLLSAARRLGLVRNPNPGYPALWSTPLHAFVSIQHGAEGPRCAA
jgi:hypothetical protein